MVYTHGLYKADIHYIVLYYFIRGHKYKYAAVHNSFSTLTEHISTSVSTFQHRRPKLCISPKFVKVSRIHLIYLKKMVKYS